MATTTTATITTTTTTITVVRLRGSTKTGSFLSKLIPISSAKLIEPKANHNYSKEAASYDTKHEKTLDKLIEEIRARLDFLGVDWVDDDESGDDDDGKADKKEVRERSVRLLDYACGTGTGEFDFFLFGGLPLLKTGFLIPLFLLAYTSIPVV